MKWPMAAARGRRAPVADREGCCGYIAIKPDPGTTLAAQHDRSSRDSPIRPGACACRVNCSRVPGDDGIILGVWHGVTEARPGALEGFTRQVGDSEPIVLINLLRYRPRADVPGEQLTGREAYERYTRAVAPLLMAVGARPIWRARGRFVLIGPAGERWDEVILVAYPSRGACERLLNLPGFRACADLRTAALEDSRLIVASAPQRVSRLTWLLYTLVTRLRGRGPAPPASVPEPLGTATEDLLRAGASTVLARQHAGAERGGLDHAAAAAARHPDQLLRLRLLAVAASR
jgi:uncharacterized protein (DUF1330 family)